MFEDAQNKAFSSWGNQKGSEYNGYSNESSRIGRAGETTWLESFRVYRTNWQKEDSSCGSGGAVIGGIVTQLIKVTQYELDKELAQHHEKVKELSDRLQLFQSIQNQLGKPEESESSE